VVRTGGVVRGGVVRAGGVVDPVKIFLTSSLMTLQNLVVVSHAAVCAHVKKNPKISGY